jgi:MFS transporter, SP family, general alpha glucoside:H+ symporter
MDSEKSKNALAAHVELEDVSSVTSLEKKMQGTALHLSAKDGAALEHDLTPLQAIKAYPTAIFWALMVSMCVVMVSFVLLASCLHQ